MGLATRSLGLNLVYTAQRGPGVPRKGQESQMAEVRAAGSSLWQQHGTGKGHPPK